MSSHRQNQDPMDKLGQEVGTFVVFGGIKLAIKAVEAISNADDKNRVYVREKSYEDITPGIVIGDCIMVTFIGNRPEQIGGNLKPHIR